MFSFSFLGRHLATSKHQRRLARRLARRTSSRPWLERLESRLLLNAGDLDPSFGTGGLVTTSVGGAPVVSLALQTDGKILAGGEIGSGASGSMGVARYNTDGSLDTSFGTNGLASGGGSASERAMALQPDGKIVVLGDDQNSATGVQFDLARFTMSSSMESTPTII
jgi:uncharacterized delta-60 repeat protein